jgi:hypothetical protein
MNAAARHDQPKGEEAMTATTTTEPKSARPMADGAYELYHQLCEASNYLNTLYANLEDVPLEDSRHETLSATFEAMEASVAAFVAELETVKHERRVIAGDILDRAAGRLREGHTPDNNPAELKWAAKIAGLRLAPEEPCPF